VGTVTIRDRGLPYRVLSRLLVGTSGPPRVEGTLVIEPGVTLLFDPEMTLEMAGTDGSFPEFTVRGRRGMTLRPPGPAPRARYVA